MSRDVFRDNLRCSHHWHHLVVSHDFARREIDNEKEFFFFVAIIQSYSNDQNWAFFKSRGKLTFVNSL